MKQKNSLFHTVHVDMVVGSVKTEDEITGSLAEYLNKVICVVRMKEKLQLILSLMKEIQHMQALTR